MGALIDDVILLDESIHTRLRQATGKKISEIMIAENASGPAGNKKRGV